MMMQYRAWLIGFSVVWVGVSASPSEVRGEVAPPVATMGDQVVIKREACRVVEPSRYRVPISLEAISTVTLVAPFDGKIKQIAVNVNAKVQSQNEVIRMENDWKKLLLNRAQLALKVATLEAKIGEKDEATLALAQAKIDLAKVDVELAQAAFDQATVRIPFSGMIQRILVTEGQFVRAGDPLAIVADTSSVKAEIPVDRISGEKSKTIGIKIEAEEIEGKVDAVVPIPPKFEPLRDLFDSIASAQVRIDNKNEKFKVGQTVYSQLIPRQPVIEVASSAVGNLPDGHRKVQVVRNNVVRDIPIVPMGQIGTNRIFVSGAFADGDEVIYESSHLLGDAFQLKPMANSSNTGTPATHGQTNSPPVKVTSPSVGF